jgi:AraC-like DNA-binding protein
MDAPPCAFAAGFTRDIDATPCPFHHHQAAELVYHPRGVGVTRLGDGSAVRFTPGDVVLYPPLLNHDQRLEGNGTDVCVQLRLGEALAPRLRGAVVARAPQPTWLTQELVQLAQAQPPGGILARQALDHRASAVLLALLGSAEAFDRDAGLDPERRLAEQAAAYIAERFQTLGRLEEVAAACGTGYDRLRRTFRRQRGASLVAWLTEVRTARAQELLAHTALGLDEIARHCGYGSARYLCRIFQAQTGTSPGEYRRKAVAKV